MDKVRQPRMDGYADFKKDPIGWWNRRANKEADAHILELRDALEGAEPHAGHYALAEMEKRGAIQSVITQNIDGLDEKARGEEPDRNSWQSNKIEMHRM
ncbi:MAG: hypothetical protein Ct9H300mP19_01580 [Dehalococcoidia bacterium]|nr:MAG: hypothetical protein Ct9H300mP19_01580 [Dehalococcoidia bacterium]